MTWLFTFTDGKSKLFEIVDTSGSEEYPAMTEMYIHRGDHFVVVYSVDCQKSFAIAQNICNEIMTIKGNDILAVRMFTLYCICGIFNDFLYKNKRISVLLLCIILRFLIAGKHFQSILLVGNKLDMVLSRTVSTDRAFKVAATDKKIWFLETSAFLKFNVHNIFCTILQMEMEKQWVRSFSDPDVAYQKRQKHVYRTISNTLCTSRVACKSAYLLTK